MTALNTPSSEFAAITDRLDTVGARFRAVAMLGGLARFLALACPATLLALFLAGYFTLPGWLHIMLMLAWGAALIFAYLKWLHRPIFQRPSYAEIARNIEQYTAPGEALDNSLINAVLLAEEFRSVPRPDSWIPHVLRELAARTEEAPLENSVPWREPRRAWIMTASLLVAAMILVATMPGTFSHGLAALLRPTSFVPHQGAIRILSVLPGNDTALAGESLAFAVTVESPDHKIADAQLQIHYASGKSAAFPMTLYGSENAQYKRENIIADQDMDYIITVGDTQSERYHITVLPELHLKNLTLEATPPAYTAKPKITISLTGKDAATAAKARLEAPQGSALSFTASLDVGPHEMIFDVPGAPPVSMTPQGNAFQFSSTARDSFHYTLRANDASNRTLHQFPEDAGPESYYTVNLTPDAPPTITALQPGKDIDAKPGMKIDLTAQADDDYGLTAITLEIAKNNDKEFHPLQKWPLALGKDNLPIRAATIHYTLDLAAAQYKLGDTLRYRFVATDNRDLTNLDPALGPQSTPGQVFTISFNDTAAAAAKTSKLWDDLRKQLAQLLDRQIALRKQATALIPTLAIDDIRKLADPIAAGQKSLRTDIAALAKDFPFDPSMKLVQKSLEVLAVEDAAQAVDRGSDILLLSDAKNLTPLATRLRQNQSRIIDVLQTLLAIAAADEDHLAKTADHEGADLPNDARDAWKKLADDLKNFEKEQTGVIDATASLAKKPKDEFDQNDQKKLADMSAIEDKWEKFLNDRLADMSKLAEQDQSQAALLDEMVQMKVELATAEHALDAKASEIATPLEENGLENAKDLTTHIERWLQQQPDRTAWQMEDPVTQNDPVMAELPKQLQDMMGDLMDKEEDLTEQMESQASKFADSIDKGAGWDAADGPISNMSAQGVTGNQLPKAMEIQGRSGEGREGQASGEMVGASAEGKEGRRTPTRLTNDPFSSGQVDDKSTLPEGGATGGGKKGGVGGEGLEGPAPQDQNDITQRLAGQQTAIRNEGERLQLQMHAANFDNFKLLESNVYLQKAQDALKAFHYQTALYYQEQAVQSLNTAKVLAAGQIHVIADTSPAADSKTQKEIESALDGPMPKGYGDPVKAYFEKLANDGKN